MNSWLDMERIWKLDGKFGIEIVTVGKRLITVRKDGIQKDIRFSRDLETISKSTVIRAIQDAFGGNY